jgi:hypothetical protein
VTPRPVTWLSRYRVAYLLPLPVLAAVAFGYFTFVFYPASASAGADRQARVRGNYFFEERNKADDERTLREPVVFIRKRILEPLRKADAEDPGNVRLRVLLANWHELAWEQVPLENRKTTFAVQAVNWAELARQANPEGCEGYYVDSNVRWRMARQLVNAGERLEKDAKDKKLKLSAQQREQSLRAARVLKSKAQREYELAAEALLAYLPRNPTDPVLRFNLADNLNKAGKVEKSRKQAAEALRLDDKVAPPRNLDRQQREQVELWLKNVSAR